MVHCLKDLYHVLAWIARSDADAPDHRCLLMTRSTVEMGLGGVLEAISMHRPSQHKFDASMAAGEMQIQKDTFFGSHQRGGGRKSRKDSAFFERELDFFIPSCSCAWRSSSPFNFWWCAAGSHHTSSLPLFFSCPLFLLSSRSSFSHITEICRSADPSCVWWSLFRLSHVSSDSSLSSLISHLSSF